jgi:hypothetical protein
MMLMPLPLRHMLQDNSCTFSLAVGTGGIEGCLPVLIF